MRNVKCPFCGEPCVRQGIENVFRCGTIGPNKDDEYQTGHTCDIMMYNRLLDEKDKTIEELKITIKWLKMDRDNWLNRALNKE